MGVVVLGFVSAGGGFVVYGPLEGFAVLAQLAVCVCVCLRVCVSRSLSGCFLTDCLLDLRV